MINKKIIVCVVMFVLLVSAVFAGGSKEQSQSVTLNPGKLTVATSPDFAPYEFYMLENGKPQLAGFDIALARYIADYMKLELEIIPMDFDGILMELQNGGADLGISGFSPNPERAEVVDFSQIYYDGKQSFVCLKKDQAKYGTIESINKKDVTVGAQIGSIQMDLAQKYSPDADLVALTKVTDLVAELVAGKIDGAYLEKPVAESYLKNYPQLCYAFDVPYDSEGNVVLVKKGNSALLEQVKAAIDSALKDGSMSAFVEKAMTDALNEYLPN
ncbi:MAG: transporter substrate-binding domain-containing protein [Sphaerochaetaceae bacterium]|nr:transporter substrate-binding domain-containing protein [Sphaerochaetaceae bacterium]